MLASFKGEHLPVVKFQSYLAGSAFALLLAAHIAMELLDANPASQYLWHVNIIFAREARPLLQHIDRFAGDSSAVTILILSGLAMLCIAAARANMRLLAASNCHIALIMLVYIASRSYVRTYPYGLPPTDTLASLGADLSVVQFGGLGLMAVLSVACVVSHVDILGRCFDLRRRLAAGAAMRESRVRA
jgi:hypothetical protein